MERSKGDRLAEFYRRLADAPAAGSLVEAKELLAMTLNEVENEMTEIPYDPSKWESDGRMYPIQEDNWRDEKLGAQRGRSRGHNTWVGPNGAIEIRAIWDDSLVFSKPGSDGRGVPR